MSANIYIYLEFKKGTSKDIWLWNWDWELGMRPANELKTARDLPLIYIALLLNTERRKCRQIWQFIHLFVEKTPKHNFLSGGSETLISNGDGGGGAPEFPKY
jgi:hypothetical protein